MHCSSWIFTEHPLACFYFSRHHDFSKLHFHRFSVLIFACIVIPISAMNVNTMKPFQIALSFTMQVCFHSLQNKAFKMWIFHSMCTRDYLFDRIKEFICVTTITFLTGWQLNKVLITFQFTIAVGIIHCIYGLAVGNIANDEHEPHPTRFFAFDFTS